LVRRQPEEQPRQPVEEPLRLLQGAEESHRPQGEPSVPMMMRQRPAGSLPLRYYGACSEGEASSTLPNNRWSAPCLM
jgi:hypothetical protein